MASTVTTYVKLRSHIRTVISAAVIAIAAVVTIVWHRRSKVSSTTSAMMTMLLVAFVAMASAMTPSAMSAASDVKPKSIHDFCLFPGRVSEIGFPRR